MLWGVLWEWVGKCFVDGKVLENQNLTSEKLLEKIKDMMGVNVSQDAVLGFTPKLKKILENSYIEAKKLDSNYISTEHMLVGMLEENDSIAKRLLIELNVNLDKIYEIVDFKWFEHEKQMKEDEILTYCYKFTEDVEYYKQFKPINNGKIIQSKLEDSLIEELNELNDKRRN